VLLDAFFQLADPAFFSGVKLHDLNGGVLKLFEFFYTKDFFLAAIIFKFGVPDLISLE